jgi:membrane-associated phospholipid phosphatase
MNKFKNISLKIKWFITAYFILLIITVLVLILFSKTDIHLWVNKHNSLFLDTFFKYITWLGDGIIIVIISLLLLFYNLRTSILVFSTYVISGILIQIIKRIVQSPRPKTYFEGIYNLHFVEGIKMYTTNSFPSGHSASAFALFLCMAIIVKNKWLQMICTLTAALIAYSRIYLSQHFLLDVTVGSVIGILTVLICVNYMNNFNQEWLNKPIYKAFRKQLK